MAATDVSAKLRNITLRRLCACLFHLFVFGFIYSIKFVLVLAFLFVFGFLFVLLSSLCVLRCGVFVLISVYCFMWSLFYFALLFSFRVRNICC